MKKTRNILILALVLVFAVGMLAGCGGEPAASNPPAENSGTPGGEPSGSDKPYDGQTINILMEDVSDCTYILELLPQFEEATGITVNVEAISYSTMHEKVAAQMISSTNSYDIIIVDYYWTGEFADAGWMYPLDDFIAADGFDTSVYLEPIMAQNGVSDGVTYQLPYYNYAMCMLYNTEVWGDPELNAAYKEEYGTELSVDDISVETYVQECEFISNYYGKDTLAGLVQQGGRGDPIVMEWLNWFFGCGGDWYDEEGNPALNSEAAVEAITLYKRALENASPTGAISFNLDDAQMMLAGGKAASMINYNWQLATLNNMENSETAGKFALAAAPGGSANVGSWGWAIPHNAKDPELSWQFLKWVESFEIAKERALMGGAPTRTDVFNDPDVLEKYPYYADVAEILNNGIGMPQVKDSNGMIETLTTALSEIVAGEKEAQVALDEVNAFMESMG